MSENLEIVEQDFLGKIQNFWNTYQKKILMAVGAIVVLFGGYYAYNNFVVKPKENKAQEALFAAEDYFAKDSFNVALNGDGASKGFLNVIKNHSGTKAANLAKYYAGICYLQIGEFAKSLEQLKDFSAPTPDLQMVAYGAMADASSELKKNDDAVSYYKKAATALPNDDQLGGDYLWRAGQLLETMNKNKEAVEMYKEVKEKFPKYKQGEIDKFIYRLSIEKNDLSVN